MINGMENKEFYSQDIKVQLNFISNDIVKKSNELSNSMYRDEPSRADIIAGYSNLMTSWSYMLRQIIKRIEEK